MRQRSLQDLPELTPRDDREEQAWTLARRRFGHYDRQAAKCRVGYLTIRLVQAGTAAGVTIGGTLMAAGRIAAILGAVILFLETTTQLLQLHHSYISYRVAAECIRAEMWSYAIPSGDYLSAPDRAVRLADRITRITLDENTSWASAMRSAATQGQGTK